MNSEHQLLSDITTFSKYARFWGELGRRETYPEIVGRNRQMHLDHLDELGMEDYEKNYVTERLDWAYRYVQDKRVFPSMRSFQFGGEAIHRDNNRMFNCGYMHANEVSFFPDLMFLLLGGSGIGYGVQKQHVAELPPVVPAGGEPWVYTIPDDIGGWAEAVNVLMSTYLGSMRTVEFDYSLIRPRGSILKTSGGRAPGPEPLRKSLEGIRVILDSKAIGSKLKPIEVHDIATIIARAVLSGGIRRSAMIALFSPDDEEMLTAKTGLWWETHPDRAYANNSAVLLRGRDDELFFNVFDRARASGSGEPGIFWVDDLKYGTNPCVTGDTWIHTQGGPRRVFDLIGRDFHAVVNGNAYEATSGGFVQTGVKQVWKVRTAKGFELRLTDNHMLQRVDHESRNVQRTTWAELKALGVGDSIVLDNHRGVLPWAGSMTFDQGWLIGNLIGDGTFSRAKCDNRKDYAALCYWGETAKHMADLALTLVKREADARDSLKVHDYEQYANKVVRTVKLTNLAARVGVVAGHKTVTDEIEREGYDFTRGVLRGLFDSDGSVQGSQLKGVSVRLSQSDLGMLQRVQRMLARVGIISTIYPNRREAGFRPMPDGHGDMKDYYCKAVHEIVIANDNLHVFLSEIGLYDPEKLDRLQRALGEYARTPNRERFSDEIVSIEQDGVEPVYDATIDVVHEFDANGIAAHNCGEITLENKGFCNLSTMDAGTITSQEDFNNRATAAAIIGTVQATYTEFDGLSEGWQETTEAEALLGVSMTGIASGAIEHLDAAEAAAHAVAVNAELAPLLGVNTAARVTTCKPEGSASLVAGTSSGIHAWHDTYFIRRSRYNKSEPIAQYLMENLPYRPEHDKNDPEIVEDVVGNPDEIVLSIPQAAPEGAVTRHEGASAMLARVLKYNRTWIEPGNVYGGQKNNISATVNIKDDEWDEVRDWMWNNRYEYNGLSLLPFSDHSYVQAPFESITHERYLEMSKKIGPIDLTEISEVEDYTNLSGELACAGGACELPW